MTAHTTFLAHMQSTVRDYGGASTYTFVTHRAGEISEQVRTLAEMDDRARRVGGWLAEAGCSGTTALLLYPAGLEFLTTFLGCLYAQVIAVPAPLPTSDPRALERAAGVITDGGIRILLTDSAHRAGLEQWLRDVGLSDTVQCVATDTLEFPAATPAGIPEVRPHDVAYLQYTSGSTQEPRGVMVTQGALLHNSRWIWRMENFPENGAAALWLPHYHDMGLLGLLNMPLYGGANMVFTSPEAFLKRPSLWLEMISRHRATAIAAPNFGYEWCATRVTDEQLRGLDLSSITAALTGAEPVRPATLEKVTARWRALGFRPEAWRAVYGIAEATLVVTGITRDPGITIGHFDPAQLEQNRARSSDAPAAIDLVSCGEPAGLDVRIVDSDTLDELPEAQVGEIWVRGDSVTAGYWRNPESTAETFHGRTSTGEGPFLRTGDLGFMLDGELYVTGRLKDLLIINGRNLYPQDFEESALVHPAVGIGAAFAVEAGREHVVLVQEVNPSLLESLTVDDLADQIEVSIGNRLRLSGVNLVLVPRGTIKRTTSGKVKRRDTRDRLLSGRLEPLCARISPDVLDTSMVVSARQPSQIA